MPIYCQSCGRTIPDDANMCPYCSAQINHAQAVQAQQPIYPPEQKKDNSKLLIAIFLIVFICIIIGIAITFFISASIYQQVSGELAGPEENMVTPNISLTAQPGSGTSSNDVTITCATITRSDISWYSVTYTLVDIDDGQQLVEYSDYQVTNSLFGTVSAGDRIEISGLNAELQENHQYRLTLTYDPTNAIMGTVTWTQ